MIDYKQLSFRSKLRSAFIMVTLLSILITGGFSYYITTNIMEENALKLTQDTVVKSAQIVDEKLNKLMIVMMTFMISPQFRNMLKDVSTGEKGNYYTHLAEMDNVFSQARIAEPLIHSIYVSTPMGEFYPLSMNRNRQTAFADTSLYQRTQQAKKNLWIEGHEDTLFLGKERVVSLILLPISDFPVSDVYVVVNIREEGLRKLVGPESDSGSSRVLLNADAAPVWREPNALVNEAVGSGFVKPFIHGGASGYTTYEMDRQDYLLNYAHMSINDWTIMAIQSKDHVLHDMIYVKWMIFLITLLAFLITALVSGEFTRYLLKPLQGLQQVMKRVEGNDLSARFESPSQDELAQVGYRFNRMLEQIVVLIDEVKQAETNKRAAEIKSLSAQIGPAFFV
ncbi:HAMP domain-containing protein [Paenibacillus sp. TAB 01]|uniref:sensor histidine kinase n=1 Tax=Paenibacillus sp. TAB 01 TaxID=3368988 RepID=UPI0037526E5E